MLYSSMSSPSRATKAEEKELQRLAVGRAKNKKLILDREAIEARVRDLLEPKARITDISPLGESGDGLRPTATGRPLCITYEADGVHQIVLRTMSPDPFGHDRCQNQLQRSSALPFRQPALKGLGK